MYTYMHTHTHRYLIFEFHLPLLNLKANGECLNAGLSFKSITNSFSASKIKAFSPSSISGGPRKQFFNVETVRIESVISLSN